MIGRLLAALRLLTGSAPVAPAAPFRLPPHPANVPGPFYVEDGCCLACGVWENEAPGLLAWLPNADFQRMMLAMEINEVDCIRVHNCKPDWAARLHEAGLGRQIDPPDGPIA